MDSTDCDFLREHKWRFRLFYASGILIKRSENKTKWTWYIFLSRFLWFVWHVGATLFCAWIRMHNSNEPMCLNLEAYPNNTSVTPPDSEEHMDLEDLSLLNIYLYATFGLVLLLLLGPIQGNIIKRNCESFPQILENIKKLEEMSIVQNEISEDEQRPLQSSDLDLEAGNVKINTPKKEPCYYRCYSENWLPKLSVGIFVVLTMVTAGLAAYKAHDTDDLWDEYKLFAVLFYLPLPVISTFFVVTLIKKINKLYKVIFNLNDDKWFTKSDHIKELSEYIGLLQDTFDLMLSKIVSYTVGINLAIFVTSAILCSYEIVQGIKMANAVNNRLQLSHQFAEVDYFLPLSICYGLMFWICRVSDRLMSNIHKKIQFRLRIFLQKLYLVQRNQNEPFKELEFVHKTLKEWPPQVYVYGGWKVNYQLLSAIILFIFTYSLKFYSFDSNAPHCRLE